MQFDINSFFYNIISGLFFVLYWSYRVSTSDQAMLVATKQAFEKIRFDQIGDAVMSIILITLLLGIGLVLHGIWRSLKTVLIFDKNKRPKIYNDNNLLWLLGKRALPEFFSSRAALWGSLIIASSLSVIAEIIVSSNQQIFYLLGLIAILTFLYNTDRYKEEETISNMVEIINERPELFNKS